MADDNVSFTDAGDPTGATPGVDKGGSSAMLDLLGNMNKKEEENKRSEKNEKKGKKGKKLKKGKGKTKTVRKSDKFESQNFLFRIEGAIFCAAIIVGTLVLTVFIIMAIVFAIKTNGRLVSYMHPLWGTTDENSGENE